MQLHNRKFVSGLLAMVLVVAAGAAAATSSNTPSSEVIQGAATDASKNAAQEGSRNVGLVIGGGVAAIASGGQTVGGTGMRRFALPGQGQTGLAGASQPAWNAWVAYSRSDVAFNFAPRQSSGNIEVGLVGVDYTLANRVIVGVAVAGDRSRIGLNFNGGNLSGSGWTIAPYIGVPLNRNWALDATIGLGRTSTDINSGGGTGTYRSERTIGSVGSTYRTSMGNWQLSGRGALLFANDRLGAYTLSNGTFIPDGTVNVTQLRLGGQAGYNFGGVVPYVGLTYVHDINRPTQQPVAGQSAANDRDAWTPTIGIRFNSGGSLYGGIQYSSEQSRSEVKNNQWLFNLGLRF
ncbi:MAG: autotransporter outer membrane beta-barrel domain-containing protein [Burkholderiales bacterium]|nr:autotransporter outer membrane beta-barrel domain-containing protein [Burkholderiales bacterium]